MGRITNAYRVAVTLVAATALLGAAVVAGATPASATLAGDGVFFACPDQTTLTDITSPSTCTSLTDAVTAAEAWNAGTRANATINLLPGKYCPVALPYDPYPITVQGLGLAGLATPSSYTGFEADLSELTWISGTCTGSPTAFLTNLPNPQEPNEIWGDLTFQNFAINGTNGVSDGIDVTNAALGLRDMLVEDLSGYGVHWQDNVDFYNGGIENSAFVGNGTGTYAGPGNSHGFSVDESLYAGNGTAISGGGNVDVGGDTIAHNTTTGLSGSFGQVVGSIVGDNTTDCSTSSYEDFGNNVYGSGCTRTTGDVQLTSTIGSPSTTGPAITPSIAPPSEASGLTGGGTCVETQDGVDQEESSDSGLSSCYAGSIQPAASVSAPVANSSPQDFGAVPTNVPATATVYLESVGGVTNVTGVSVAKSSGTGSLGLNYTTCEYFLLFKEFDRGSCSVSITATAVDTSGTTSGTVTFHTGSGDIVDDLTFTGAPAVVPPDAPTNLIGTAKNNEVDMSWNLTPTPGDGGQPIQFYEVYDSVDGGKTWKQFYSDYDVTDDPASITDSFDVRDNTTYEFRVVANNGFADSDPSNLITLTPGVATSISGPASKTIQWGTSDTLHASVISFGQPVTGQTVHLQKHLPGVTTWSPAGSSTTDTNGDVSLSVAPTRTTAYRWTFNGHYPFNSSSSAPATITVAQAVTARLSAAKVKHGKRVTVYGAVQPSAKGQTVTVQVKSGSHWKTVGTAKLIVQKLPNGKKTLGYAFGYKPRTKGKQTLRVIKAATAANAAGTSPSLHLKIT